MKLGLAKKRTRIIGAIVFGTIAAAFTAVNVCQLVYLASADPVFVGAGGFVLITLAAIAPALVYWATAIMRWLGCRFSENFWWKFLFALSSFWFLFSFVPISVLVCILPTRDLSRYQTAVQSFPSELTDHFPRTVPADARDVRFYWLPSFLQGRGPIQLRYAVSAAEIASLRERFSQISMKEARGAGTGSDSERGNVQCPPPRYLTGDGPGREFPEDYELFVLDKKDARLRSHGVAISVRRREIVYWLEPWF